MGETNVHSLSELILDELRGALGKVREHELLGLADAVAKASGAFVTGQGRSGLIARCFAMRLVHLGLLSHAVGDTTTPAIKSTDLLIAVSRTGETPLTLALARQASDKGATVAAVTAVEESGLASSADLAVIIPDRGRNASGSAQYGGSLFEQTALIVFDAIALHLQQRLNQDAHDMDARHANLE